MSETQLVVAIALGCAAVVGVLGWLGLRTRSMRSLRTTIAVATACSVLTVVAGVVGAAQAMFLSAHDFRVVLLVCAAGSVVATTLGLLLAREVVGEAGAVRDVAQAIAGGEQPATGVQPRTTELAAISTELAATSRSWAESREREATLEAARRELVSWISHDLRTPLAGLRAMAEALEDDMVSDPERYHRQIRLEVDRLSEMVGDLFQLSRLHAGTAPNREPVALHDLVSDTLAAAAPVAVTRGVKLQSQTAQGLTVLADPGDLSRVLANLVSNAVAHTADDGSVLVSIDRRGASAVIGVQDECGGIPEADLARVFDVAWRGTPARTPGDDTGAGLGLAIVRGIVAAHGGSVQVVNSERGCRFEVRLPLAS